MSTPAISSAGRVCAIIVTFNRKDLLHQSVSGFRSQTRGVDKIVVVNNASTDGTSEMLARDFPDVHAINLSENTGGAGGFYAGMKWAYQQGYEWIWVTDDDGFPAPDCLEQMFRQRIDEDVMIPIQEDRWGQKYGFAYWNGRALGLTADVIRSNEVARRNDCLFTFVGPVFARTVIDKVGLPYPHLFIHFDDWEYALRINTAGGFRSICVPQAIMYHTASNAQREVRFLNRRKMRDGMPPWRTYYATRNLLFAITRTTRKPRELVHFALLQVRSVVGDLMYESLRWKHTRFRFKGLLDGLIGRMGKRVAPGA
jgi:rhamnopyranosyl-N-acetylglucosaminyl-diphospho-decaprenol beta-1,3/1,4-galactofuranosyltransferase